MEKDQGILNENDLKFYLNRFDIGQLIECSFLKKGLNYSYLVITTTGKYIYRIYRNQWRCLEDILYEVEALTHIYKSYSNISVPIAYLNKEYIQQIYCLNKSYYGVLFSYAEGHTPDINEDSSFKLGKMLAKIHICTNEFKSKYKRSYNIDVHHLLDEPLLHLSSKIETYLSKESCEFIYKLANYIKHTLMNLELEWGFCHGDLHDWNVHCQENSYTIFDFDCCGIGFRAYDLAVYWWNLKVNYPEKEEVCWKAFKSGYLNTRTLRDIDLMAIPLFVIARKYWLAGILLKNEDVFGAEWINEVGLNHFLSQIKDDVKDYNITI